MSICSYIHTYRSFPIRVANLISLLKRLLTKSATLYVIKMFGIYIYVVRTYICMYNFGNGCRLGATCNDTMVNIFLFFFETGKPLSTMYTKWAPGEPNNAHNNENCLMVGFNGYNDLLCTDLKPYVCKRSALNMTRNILCESYDLGKTRFSLIKHYVCI